MNYDYSTSSGESSSNISMPLKVSSPNSLALNTPTVQITSVSAGMNIFGLHKISLHEIVIMSSAGKVHWRCWSY